MNFIITDDYITSVKEARGENAIVDLERALYVLQGWQKKSPDTNPVTRLREYMIRTEAIDWLATNLFPKFQVEVKTTPKRERRKDKYAKLERFALDNIYHEFTTQQLVDASGLGAQTITKWAKTTGFFRVIGKGKWEARNPKDDRELGR